MLLLRLVLGIALIAVLLWTGLLDPRALAVAWRHPIPLFFAALALFGTLLAAGLRWYVLLRVQRIRLPLAAALRVVLASSFLSTFLPGAVGGDLLRSGYVLRLARDRASTGLLSIVMDRVLGLLGLLLMAALFLLVQPAGIPAGMRITVLALLATLIAGGLALPRITRWLARRTPPAAGSWRAVLGKALRELHGAITAYRRARPAVLAGLLLSVAVCGFDVCGLLLVMRALRIDVLPWIDQALACVLALVANNVPFTPGGLGIGEAAFANAALALEPFRSGAPYATAFLAYRCVTVIASLPGAFLGLGDPAAHRAASTSAPPRP